MMKKNNAKTNTKTDARYDAIYARQSIDKHGSLSIKGQIAECKARCNSKVVLEYEEAGKSGKDTDRPELQRLLNDIEQGKIKRVIVYKLDRLSRNVRDFYDLHETFTRFGVTFISTSEGFETETQQGRMFMGILAIFAQMERENIVDRVTKNYYFRIKERGSWPGGKCPFGFTIGLNEEKHKTLIPNEHELKAIKKMFEMYASNEGTSLTKIVNTLRDEGYRTKNGSVISASAISKTMQYLVYVKADEKLYHYLFTKGFEILSPIEKWDGKYSAHVIGKNGKAVSTKSDNSELSAYVTNFEGIIDSTTFITVHERLSRNERLGRGNGESPIGELAGLLKCEKCGYSIKNYAGKLRCSGQVQHKLCTAKYSHLAIQEVQERVADEVQIIINAADERKRTAEKVNVLYSSGRAELQKQLENLVRLAEVGEETPEFVYARITELQKAIHNLDLRIAMNDITSNIEMVDYKAMSHQERKQVLKTLVRKIELETNGYCEIDYKSHVGDSIPL